MSLGMAAGVFAGITEAFFALPVLPLTAQDPTLISILLAVIIAPVVEEPTKLLGLYIINFSEDVSIRMRRWIILGIFCGLGFALFENLLYIMSAAIGNGLPGVGLTFVSRTMLSLPFHLIASAVAAYGFGLFANTGRVKYFFLFLALAMFIHGLYNLTASIL